MMCPSVRHRRPMRCLIWTGDGTADRITLRSRDGAGTEYAGSFSAGSVCFYGQHDEWRDADGTESGEQHLCLQPGRQTDIVSPYQKKMSRAVRELSVPVPERRITGSGKLRTGYS